MLKSKFKKQCILANTLNIMSKQMHFDFALAHFKFEMDSGRVPCFDHEESSTTKFGVRVSDLTKSALHNN